MLAVGDVQAGDSISLRIVCGAGETSTMTVTAALMDYDAFWRGYDILNASTLELTEFESTHVEGKITCNRDGLLYTSIPQNGNWHAQVDGREAEIKLVGDCMIGLELAEGEHTVSFTYENRAFSIGWKISLLCAAIFLVLAFREPKHKTGKYQK